MIAVFTLGLIAIFSYGISSVLRAEEMKSYFVEYMAKRNVPQDVITAMVDLLNKKDKKDKNNDHFTYNNYYDDDLFDNSHLIPGHNDVGSLARYGID